MMRHLMEDMKTLEDQELRYAQKDHGDAFRGFAAGYLALAEEIQEAQVATVARKMMESEGIPWA